MRANPQAKDNTQTPVGANQLLEVALAYAKLGWPVLPLWWPLSDGRCACPAKEKCPSPGKHPLPELAPQGYKSATTDPATIRAWWQSAPQGNIGIGVGEQSGLAVLDVDPRNQGDEALRELGAEHGKLPDTITALTGGGGTHYYFAHQPDLGGRDLAPGLELKTKGLVVAPPSLHVSGRRYAWEVGYGPGEIELALAPAWLKELIQKRGAANRGRQGGGGHGAWRLLLEPIPQGKRHASLVRIAGWLHLYHPEAIVRALLLAINVGRCQPPLDSEEVAEITQSVCRYPTPGGLGHPRAVVADFTRREANNG